MDKANINSYKFVLEHKLHSCLCTCQCLCVMGWASVSMHNACVKCYFCKWLLPPSDMHVIGFHINEIKAWAIS